MGVKELYERAGVPIWTYGSEALGLRMDEIRKLNVL